MKYVSIPLMCGLLVLAGCSDNNADSQSNDAETTTDVQVVGEETTESDAVEALESEEEQLAEAEEVEAVEDDLMEEDELEDDYVNPDAGIPNVWRTGFGQGYQEYYINDAKGTQLSISCNEAAGQEKDHYVFLDYQGETYSNTNSEYPVTLLVDDAIEVAAPESTDWRNGANAWNELAENVAQASKIDAYLHNKKVATFTPSPANVAKVVSELASCQGMLYQDQDNW